MPTNILRSRSKPTASQLAALPSGGKRLIAITAGRITIRAEVLDTPTSTRLLAAMPLHTTAETWGDALHFEVPVHSGRERGARINATRGDICFWGEEQRVIIGFGPTPISRASEIRLPSPCNLWARAIDDVTLLKTVRPGEKVSVMVVAG